MCLLPEFESKLGDPEVPVAVDFSSESSTLLIAFAGLAGKIGMPVFEFSNLTRGLDVKRIFVRDPRLIWYHHGLPGIGDSIEDIVSHIGMLAAGKGIKKTVVVGNSMGGYAAILFGCLLDADEVLAFSPKTFINPYRRLICLDTGAWPHMWRLQRSRRARKDLFDLKAVLRSRKPNTSIHVHFSVRKIVDIVHALRIRKCPHVHLHLYGKGGHGLIRLLKNSGKLEQILRASLS